MTRDEIEKPCEERFGSSSGWFKPVVDFALAMCERQKERAAMIAQDGNIAPFQPGMLGGDTIPIVMRKHIAAAIRADAPKVEK